MSEVPPQNQPEAAGPGAVLLAERRRQNLSLGDVSRQLKLSVRQVEALERDDFAGFQGPVFIHGFLRNYAKLLALDPVPLVRAADRLLAPAAAVENDAPAPPNPKPAAGAGSKWPLMAAAVAAAAGIVLLAVYPREDTESTRHVGPAAQIAAVPVSKEKRAASPKVPERAASQKTVPDKPDAGKGLPEKPAAQRSQEQDEESRASENMPATTSAHDESAGETATSLAAEGVAEALDGAESGEAIARKTLRMIFDQESWVEVKDRNGNTVFGQLNAAGTRRSASGEPPLTVVVGNAAGVRLFLGDESIDLAPHTRVDVARFTVE